MSNYKNDLRYLKTERAIRRAFHELLQTKDIKRITVRELAERAEINKTTFYSHYETLPDLIDTLERENIDYIIDHLDQVQVLYEDSDLFVDNLYHNLLDCRITLIGKNGAGSQQFISRLKKRLLEELENRNIQAEQYSQTAVLLIFILHGLLGIINSGKDSGDEIEYIKHFVKAGIQYDFMDYHKK